MNINGELTVIFLSALDIWSISEGVGAPSFYKTLKLYVDKGDHVVLIKPTGRFHSEYEIRGLKVLSFNNDLFDYLTSKKIISFFARFFSQWYKTYKFISIAKNEILAAKNKCVIYAYEVHAVKAATILSKMYNIPFITRFQGTVLNNKKSNIVNKLKMYPHFSAIAQKSDLVIMTNDGTFGNKVLSELQNKSERVLFWRNGVDFQIENNDLTLERKMQRRQWGIDESTFVFMTLSRLAHWKRIDRAILSLSVVIKTYPNCKLVIIGDGDMKDNLTQLAEELGIADKIIFYGGILQKDTWKAFNAADVFLSLYDIGNLGNPIFEALYMGKPIITLNNGNTSSVIEDEYNALMLPEGNDNLISSAMIRLYENPELRIKISNNAKEYAKQNLWTWQERMESEYNIVTNVVDDFYQNRK